MGLANILKLTVKQSNNLLIREKAMKEGREDVPNWFFMIPNSKAKGHISGSRSAFEV